MVEEPELVDVVAVALVVVVEEAAVVVLAELGEVVEVVVDPPHAARPAAAMDPVTIAKKRFTA